MSTTDLSAALAWLSDQGPAMEQALAQLVGIDSNSHDKAGTDAVADAMAGWFTGHGVDCERAPEPAQGDALVARLAGSRPDAPPVLLMGHRDTVFPTGTVARRPYRREGDTAYGPGVADMKSGLVLQAFVLMALKHAPALPFPVVGLFTADEEIGSARGRLAIESWGRGAHAALNAEPARVTGNVVSARKGGATIRIAVRGRAAHSGVNHAEGASAIGALAIKVQALHALTDYASGVTTNVGLIGGGLSSNTVAPEAEARLDVRFCTAAQRLALLEAVDAIVKRSDVPGTDATFEVVSEFLPLEPRWSEALLALYQESARASGFEVEGEFTGGCSDAGFTAAMGIPTLCGLGPVGAKAHTEGEYCRLETFVPRAQAVLRMLGRMADSIA